MTETDTAMSTSSKLEEVVSQGAEGKIYYSEMFGQPTVVKIRLSKKYRVAVLDKKLNKQRLLQEAKCMARCRRAGVLTPSIYLVDTNDFELHMERIFGFTVKEILRSKVTSDHSYDMSCTIMAKKIGAAIGKMHEADVCHGDLTTSNIMVRTASRAQGADTDTAQAQASASASASAVCAPAAHAGPSQAQDDHCEIILIDFGLGMMKPTVEDKAVDLYVLERAFISTHPGSEALVADLLDAYRFNCMKGASVLLKLEQVRLRGRKREMIG